MSSNFQSNDPSIESQWRAIILFGKNSATYKFAFAKALLKFIESQSTKISLNDLALPYVDSIVEHLRLNERQGNANSSRFLNGCRDYINNKITREQLYELTLKYGFIHVVDAFQNLNGAVIPNIFYEKDYTQGKKQIILTDSLLSIGEQFQFKNLEQEVDARWNLVETAWNLNINPNLLEVRYDANKSLFFLESDLMRRVDITSVRDSLNGYQKGKCFYSFLDLSINKNDPNICEIDHFLPHVNKQIHTKEGANINGVWNLVLTDPSINSDKKAKIPEKRFLERLFNRNEFYIESKHPLPETIVNQTGKTKSLRIAFLNKQYNIALNNSIQKWKPQIENPSTF